MAMSYQVLLKCSLSCESQFRFCCHRFCKKSLAVMVTGEIRPRGSKILEVHFKISRFVASMVDIVASGLGEANIMSE